MEGRGPPPPLRTISRNQHADEPERPLLSPVMDNPASVLEGILSSERKALNQFLKARHKNLLGEFSAPFTNAQWNLPKDAAPWDLSAPAPNGSKFETKEQQEDIPDEIVKGAKTPLDNEKELASAPFEEPENLREPAMQPNISLKSQGDAPAMSNVGSVRSVRLSVCPEVAEWEKSGTHLGEDLGDAAMCPPSVISSRFSNDDFGVQLPGNKVRVTRIRGATPKRTSLSSGQTRIMRAFAMTARSEHFELFFAFLILANAVVMCIEAQYWGFQIGHELGYKGMSQPASQVWPNAEISFRVLDILFGVAFSAEVVVKACGLRKKFILSFWNCFDTLIIASWLVHLLFENVLQVNPFLLRIFRLAKLVRILRLVKSMQVFDILHLMVASLKASVYVLLWSVVLLVGIMVTTTLIMVSLISFYITDDSMAESSRLEAFNYFGTFTQGMLSVFEVTLGNFIPITRFLHDEISEWFGVSIMIYHCLVSFAVVMVIRGVFLHETFQVAGESDDLMIMRQTRMKMRTVSKMEALFGEADEDEDGFLSEDEFVKVMHDRRVKTWLEAMGLEVRDAERVFEVMDDGDHRISAEEFVSGFNRLKGPAKALDMVQVLRLSKGLAELVHSLVDNLGVDQTMCSRFSLPPMPGLPVFKRLSMQMSKQFSTVSLLSEKQKSTIFEDAQ